MSVLKPLKAKTRSAAEKLADKWFSLYTRIRYTDFRGVGKCITCSVTGYFKDKNMNCGHFVLRGHKATRWHSQNGHLQCVGCNKWKDGNQYEHGKQIDLRYGKGTADHLVALSRTTTKYSITEIIEIAEHCRNLALAEAVKRGITL